jgi:signal transduction histidine kinase
MTGKLQRYLLPVFALIALAMALFFESRLYERNQTIEVISGFQKKLTEKEKLLKSQLETIREISESPGFSDSYLSELRTFNQSLENNGSGFLIYRNRKLFYWSDREIAFNDTLSFIHHPGPSVVFLPNGYYLADSLSVDTLKIIGLILIKNNYTHENQYLKNTFHRDFGLPEQFMLADPNNGNGFSIKNLNGKPVFSLVPGEEYRLDSAQTWLPLLFYLTGIAMLLVFFKNRISKTRLVVWKKLLLTLAFLLGLYGFHILFHIPDLFNRISYFSPVHFALGSWLPSLGDFFLLSVFLFFFFIIFYREFRFKTITFKKVPEWLLIISVLTGLAVVYILNDYFISQVIFNSSFSFTLNKINLITIQSVLGIASFMLLLFSLILLSVRIAMEISRFVRLKKMIMMTIVAFMVAAILQGLLSGKVYISALLLFLAIFTISAFYAVRTTVRYGMSFLVLFISLVTVYSLEIIYRVTVDKEREVQKLMAGNLVNEHDPAAEVFLSEIMQQISMDPQIPGHLVPPFSHLDEYLETTYFSGFFRQYDLQITICTGADSLMIRPQNTKTPCYPFFENMISHHGMLIPGTNFYYMDNMDGRISYLGNLHYPLASDSLGVSVFIDLKSRVQSEGIGFPELLIDQSMRKPDSYKRFDYAKYSEGELVDRHGSFMYNYYIYSYNFDDREFSYNVWDGYEHLIHKVSEDNYVIVSRSLYTFIDYLISFPYLFVFYFLFSIPILMLIQPSFRKNRLMFDLKFRIQAAIISIVFVSLLLVALSTILYNLDESRSRLQEDLDQKMNSIALEMDIRLGSEKMILPEMKEWMMPELVRLSNIFQTDINIFGVDGTLVVSSRPEIFNRGLVSGKINSMAYYELFENFQTNYFQPEKIGEMSYLSAYEPIINDNGDYLGFINLPYFTHQDKYSQEISTFIVAFINLYVLLFLASIMVAIFISNQITLPLTTIRENLRKIELGKRSEPIDYRREDEIGKLVREYNKKVDELSISAELLARSERESAWREMAKQVAHEIKNPLTPMKLNIQHLQRFRGEGMDYQEYVNRICQTLIGQIDTLSEIATEFSNFAQIPTAMKQVFDLAGQISKVIGLYENNDRINISFEKKIKEDILVNADREQLSRALINLIKNGIQAVPEDKEGSIEIFLDKKEHMAVISVKDNGTGISPELQEKMFNPNFTTKSSGMGLGLAIVKNIAENFNGRVWFETVMNQGTTFHLEIPVFDGKSISPGIKQKH